MRPSRIIVGEVRQAESLDLLIALNSGLPGMCTVHANSAREAVTKMCTLPLLAGDNVSASLRRPHRGQQRRPRGPRRAGRDGVRRVREIVALPGRVEGDVVETADIFATRGGRLVAGRGLPAARRAVRAPAASTWRSCWPPSRDRRSGERRAGRAAAGRRPVLHLVVVLARSVLGRAAAPVGGAVVPAERTSWPRPACERRPARAADRPAASPSRLVALVVTVGDPRARRSASASAPWPARRRWRWCACRARRRRAALRDVWPDAVDNLASAVRAGLSLPEALAQLAVRGPAELRPAFAAFAEDYRATGRFADCLDRLKDRLADPVGRPAGRGPAHRPRGRRQRPRPAAAHPVGLPARGRPHPWRAGDPAELDGQRRPAGRRRAVDRAGHAGDSADRPSRRTTARPGLSCWPSGRLCSLRRLPRR